MHHGRASRLVAGRLLAFWLASKSEWPMTLTELARAAIEWSKAQTMGHPIACINARKRLEEARKQAAEERYANMQRTLLGDS